MQYYYEKVLKNESTAPGIFQMVVRCHEEPKPGQFYMVRRESHGSALLLPRPISVANWSQGEVTFIYQVVGRGTAELEDVKPGETVYLLGPQGNGFPMDLSGPIALVAGGVGTAPMIYTARKFKEKGVRTDVFLGFQDAPYGVEELKAEANSVKVSSEKGRVGTMGRVTDIFSPEGYEAVFCCGPTPMMEAVTKQCEEAGVPVYLSLENKMACAVGTCLLCTCRTKDGKSLRTCKEGPVFRGEEVDFHAGNHN